MSLPDRYDLLDFGDARIKKPEEITNKSEEILIKQKSRTVKEPKGPSPAERAVYENGGGGSQGIVWRARNSGTTRSSYKTGKLGNRF